MKTPGWPRSSCSLRRVSALVLLLLLAAGTAADAAGLDNCAHHDVPAAAASPASAKPAGGHDHAGMHGGETTPADPATPERSGCTCIGDCAGPAILDNPVSPAVQTALPTTFAAREVYRETERVLRATYLDMLPYSNAPPTVHSTV